MVLDVCPAPGLFEIYAKENQLVVVIDVVRMSTSMCVAFHYGVKSISPVAYPEDALSFRKSGYLISGERNSYQLEGFDYGNSPYDFMNEDLKGKKLAMTTTNGTFAISIADHSNELLIGSYINQNALLEKLLKSERNILLMCAGWNQRINAEDTLFAGTLVHILKKHKDYEMGSDSVLMAENFYLQAESKFDWVIANSHRFSQHLPRLEQDIRFCLEPPYQVSFVPYLNQGDIII